MLTKLLVILLSIVASSRAAPATSYDQRQEGDLNVKVDLDNFVILVARPTSNIDVFDSLAELFADVKRASSTAQLKAQLKSEPKTDNPLLQDEIKLDKSAEFADVSLEEEQSKEDTSKVEMLALAQEADKAGKNLEDVAKNLRNLKEKEKELFEQEKSKVVKYKFIEAADDTLSLKLIGEAVENCGPGRSRDRLGICQEQN